MEVVSYIILNMQDVLSLWYLTVTALGRAAAEAAAAEVEADERAFSNVIILFRRYLIKTNLSSEYQVFCM